MAFPVDGNIFDLTKTMADATGGEAVLGSMVRASDGNWYQYVHASGAIAQYDFVKVDYDFEITTLTTAASGTEPTAVGCAQVAFADNDYGWVARGGGTFTGQGAAAIADNAKIYTTATAGEVDDDSSGADLIQGLTITAALGAQGNGSFRATDLMKTNGQD